MEQQLSQCPVCKARFRGTRYCSRCGGDLGPLMVLTVKAFQFRQAARQALCWGDYRSAYEQASQAQSIRYTAAGRRLQALSLWLAESQSAV